MYFSIWLILLHDFGITLPFAAGVVRLVNGNQECSGRVEVFLNGEWGTVCDDFWDINDAAVVCKEAGCGIALQAKGVAFFGQGSIPILMDDVGCVGTEVALGACGHVYPSNCGHGEDAGVICQSLRLVSGSSICSGRLEILHEGVWGTVCSNGWDITDAAVLCKGLGCGNPVVANAFFGEGTGQIWMDNVSCQGSESTLSSCGSNGWGVSDCAHASDVGVVCRELKLLGSGDSCSGTVQILHNDVWGTVCQDSWDVSDAAVVCRELGCGSHAEAKISAFFGQGTGPTWMDFVSCKGDEATLKTCAFGGWGVNSCAHQYDAGVICKEIKERKMVRIEVKVSPGVDTNNPTFKMMIMEMMKKKGEETGYNTLQWRTLVDGGVFQKCPKCS
ncbi:hypothetical protein NFI96_012042 [Prochilodus magdalenae]|nr:hypothetical protein NFI96_012042 [Prochilodus magdalenae]